MMKIVILLRDQSANGGARRGLDAGLVVWAAGAWAAGLTAGRWAEQAPAWAWLAGGAGAMVAAAIGGRSNRRIACAAAVLCMFCTAAGWWGLRTTTTGDPWGQIDSDSRLAMLQGVVEGESYHRLAARGLMGRFDYRAPGTSFVLRVGEAIDERGERQAMSAGVLVHVPEYDDRLRAGQRVRCAGWLAELPSPGNPGERDFARFMRERGVAARLSAKTRGHVTILDEPAGGWSAMRAAMIDRARRSLTAGLPAASDPATAAMLQSLLLGERRGELGDLQPAFAATGLSHLLAISGLNLAILAGGAWWITHRMTGRRRWAAAATIAVVGGYVWIVPPEVPIVRAAVMMAVAGAAALRRDGGRGAGLSALAAAALGLMIWRPADLFTAGFQLSFGVVGGLIVLAGPLADRWAPRPAGEQEPSGGWRFRRTAAEAGAVCVTAWSVSLPLVAHHFQAVSPAALPVSLAIGPVATALLWLGYVKMIAGMVWLEAGRALAAPVWALSRALAESVRWAAEMPGASFDVPVMSGAWAAATLAVVVALLRGAWRRPGGWRWAAALVICAAWTALPTAAERWRLRDAELTLNMFAVGDGSCYLLRSGGEAMVFDCGSNHYIDITTASVGPALRSMGVMRVPTLVVSHPDADHFSGALELIDHFQVRRVLLSDEFLRVAGERPQSAAGFLVAQVRRRGVEIGVIGRGWRAAFGGASVQAIWPPPGRRFERDNDGSIVLSIRCADRRVLLTGDIQTQAIASLLELGDDLRADVVELPHHGSHPPLAPRFIAAVAPSIVLQSTGPARLRDDPWAAQLAPLDRRITARHGMVELTIDAAGRIAVRSFARRAFDPAEEPILE
jgi:competence protein ComEC